MKKNIWLALLCLGFSQNAMGEMDPKEFNYLCNLDEKPDQKEINKARGYIEKASEDQKNDFHLLFNRLLDLFHKREAEIKQRAEQQKAQQQAAIEQKAQQQQAQQPQPVGGGYEMPAPEQISAVDAVIKLARSSVADLLNDSKYELYRRGFYNYYVYEGVGPENDVAKQGYLLASNKIKAVDAIKDGESPKDIPTESRKLYDDYIKNNGPYKNAAQKDPVKQENEDFSEEVAQIDAVHNRLLQKRLVNPGDYISDEEWGKLSMEQRGALFPNYSMSDEEWEKIWEKLSMEQRLALFPEIKVEEHLKGDLERDLLPNASEEAKEPNASKENEGPNEGLDQQQKPNAQKVKKDSPGQDVGIPKIWAMVANELRGIVSQISHNNYAEDFEDFRVLMHQKYVDKNKNIKEQVGSDFDTIKSFLKGEQEGCSAFDLEEFGADNPEPYAVKTKKELIAVMKKFEHYFGVCFNSKTYNKKIADLIRFVDKRSKKMLLGKDALRSVTKKKVDALGGRFGFAKADEIERFIQKIKLEPKVFGLEQVESIISKWIPQEASALEDVCKYTMRLKGKPRMVQQTLDKIDRILKEMTPFYAHFGWTADRNKVNALLCNKIDHLADASAKKIKEIQEDHARKEDLPENIREKRMKSLLNRQPVNALVQPE